MRNDAFIHLQGVLNGPYYHFWFLYLIVGLYLLTPVLRVILAHAKRSLLKYSLLLWLAGTTIVSVLAILACDDVSGNVFLIIEWLGYFVLIAYMVGTHCSSLPLYIAVISGYLCTIIGTYFVVGLIGERVWPILPRSQEHNNHRCLHRSFHASQWCSTEQSGGVLLLALGCPASHQ